jgi:hypothetical protein
MVDDTDQPIVEASTWISNVNIRLLQQGMQATVRLRRAFGVD